MRRSRPFGQPELANRPGRRTNVLLLLICTIGALVCAEVGLRLGATQLATYSENNGLPYVSHYKADRGRLNVYEPGQDVRLEKPEFVHTRTANSLGLADREVPLAKVPDEYRILALGDSFTEGVGASEDATWVRVMERDIQARYPHRRITTINAGISGSDPFDAYAILKDRLLPLRADLAILVLNNSDINEVVVRGGQERFQPDGALRYRQGPFWEPVYALSFLARLVVHAGLGFNYFLIRGGRMPAELETAGAGILAAVEEIQRLCGEHGMPLLVVVSPIAWEVQQGSYEPEFEEALNLIAGNPRLGFVDLLKDFGSEGTITPSTVAGFYWPLDYHHNERGYAVMGGAIARHVAGIVR